MEWLMLFSQAASIIGAFKGSAQVAKITQDVQDAVAVVGALMPLVQDFSQGNEVSEESVRDALAGFDTALADLDALIAAKSG